MNLQFTSLRPLGAGGNGDCFLGVRRDTGEHVVVKVLRESHLPDARRRFAREVRVLANKLRGLVPVLWADLKGARPYYVMPFLPGGAVTAHAGRLTDPQLRTVAREVCSTLVELHGRFIAHGDVKPDNILVGSDGHLRVADPLGNGFGCTVLFSENRGGTPGYWAPEIKGGAQISQSGDVYSLGATIYHLATGRIPRDDEGVLIPADIAVSPVVREMVVACCAVDASARPTMRDVLRILNGEKWNVIRASRRNWQIAAGVTAIAGFFLWISQSE